VLEFWAGSKNENRYRITKLMLGTGFRILGRQQNKNRYHITKLILCTGFWDSGKAAKNRYHITELILGTGFWYSGKAAKKIDIALLS
jgi:hypothetical protein